MTKTFIWAVMAVALAGAAVGWGASLFVEPASGELESAPFDPANASLEELRQAAANDPELQAVLREAAESGQLPGAGAAGPGAGGTGAAGAGARNATPLTGAVSSFQDGLLTLDTPEGPAEIAVDGETPVTLMTTAGEAAAHLTEGAQVTVAGTADAEGVIAAFVVSVGAQEGPGLGGFGMLAAVSGAVESYDGAALTVATEDGSVEAAVSEQTIVRVATAASEAADELANGATVTAFVRRNADGTLTAANVIVSTAGALGAGGPGQAGGGLRGFGGAQRGRDGGQ